MTEFMISCRACAQRQRSARRRGISLLEVIACTVLLAVMMVPIAGVIRASGQSIRQAQGGDTTHSKLRTTLRWLRETIQDGQVMTMSRSTIQLQLKDGRLARIAVNSGDLILDDGTSQVPLASDIRDVRFQALRSAVPPRDQIGIQVRIRARDPSSGTMISIDSTIADTPQL